ncbi:SHOCT domain-containing protein [Clostridium cellulovorans]|uniref:Uncharacterized protein n=1 Tax=Clostridium cellulovorans (strain ATCC 35296 / DSM 3052 / OCM 3 / 743B) TaxID=573061 RepID=D9SPI3_CLOC7|nr:SHOCT domain-containing protein [Clostridium cellulovorans]ADL50032.1 Protein of unknown function DUF2078, membrane [Clostridium cellulovorans 743B]
MRHGYHMGFGLYGSYILIFLLIAFSVLAVLFFKSKPVANPFTIKLIDILKEKYAAGIITADEYIERKMIIEELKFVNPYTPVLLERYAQCLIDTKDFLIIRNILESKNLDSSISEGLAKGLLPYEDFKDI